MEKDTGLLKVMKKFVGIERYFIFNVFFLFPFSNRSEIFLTSYTYK